MSLKEKRQTIVEFRNWYEEFRELSSNAFPAPEEEARIAELRSLINRATAIVVSNLNAAGEPTSVHYAPAPIVGGFSGRVDLITNIFNPGLHGVEQSTFDMLDRGIGRYDYLIENRWKDLINPFYWIGKIIRAPFYLMKFAGFNANRIEISIVGKIYKFVAGLFAFAVSVFKLWEYLKPYLILKGLIAP